jgi:cold shock CspA family protein
VNSEVIGTVVSFDFEAGFGFLESADGQQWFFHCIDIADGSRSIAVGSVARGVRVVGRLGRDELVGVQSFP